MGYAALGDSNQAAAYMRRLSTHRLHCSQLCDLTTVYVFTCVIEAAGGKQDEVLAILARIRADASPPPSPTPDREREPTDTDGATDGQTVRRYRQRFVGLLQERGERKRLEEAADDMLWLRAASPYDAVTLSVSRTYV